MIRTDDSIELPLSFPYVLDRVFETEGFPTREDTILLEVELSTFISSGRTQKPPSLSSKMAQCRYKGYFVIEGFLFSCLFICHGEYDSEISCISDIISIQHYFHPI